MRIGIYGYGNLGRGVENAIAKNPDMELVAVFTRRSPETLKINTPNVPVVSTSDVNSWTDLVDVMIICGGSATDLPTMTPDLAKMFNVVDSYDNHSSIPTHFANVDAAAKESGKVALISCGWDPGMFSLMRLYSDAVLPDGKHYTFWGRGVSQGHSDAIRRIDGVLDARQYTVPVEAVVDEVRKGSQADYTSRQMHKRECYVVAEDGADLTRIEQEIVTMPAYFAPYDTTVHFITMDELKRDHMGLPHGGNVIRTGVTGDGNKQVIEYKLSLDSNPEFTGSVLVTFARAVDKMSKRGDKGCKTVFDVTPADLMSISHDDIVAHLL